MNKNLVRLARITKPGSGDQQFYTQQMEYLGKLADVYTVFPYGFHGNIPADELALMLNIQGTESRVAIPWAPKKRPTLATGEVAFYHPPTDAFIIWRSSGDLDLETGTGGTGNINIKASDINITADVNITGNTAFTGTVTANGKDISDTHGHTQGNDSGGDTEAVISGVT